MQGEHFHQPFNPSLAIGRYNEDIIGHEFGYHGIKYHRPEGKSDFDFILADGRSVEVKLDMRSQATGKGAIELPTLLRRADIYIHTLTYARVFTFEEYERLYLHEGKLPWNGMGDLGYEGRLVSRMGQRGKALYQFINELKEQQRIH